MKYKQRDIILIPFPFTDNFTISKKRPALIISNNSISGQNYIVVKITSTIKKTGRYSFTLNNSDIDFKLKKPSEVRTDQIFTIHETIIIKKLGTLSQKAFNDLIQKIISHLKPS